MVGFIYFGLVYFTLVYFTLRINDVINSAERDKNNTKGLLFGDGNDVLGVYGRL